MDGPPRSGSIGPLPTGVSPLPGAVGPSDPRQERRLRIARISQENFLELIGHLDEATRVYAMGAMPWEVVCPGKDMMEGEDFLMVSVPLLSGSSARLRISSWD